MKSLWPAGGAGFFASAISALMVVSCATGPDHFRNECADLQGVRLSLDAFAEGEAFEPSVAWADLDGDGRPEAIALMNGRAWCGTGGCTLVVLRRDGREWKVRSHTPAIRPPVSALPTTTNGWRDLSVIDAGGGNLIAREVLMRFEDAGVSLDGAGYAKQPVVAPPGERQVLLRETSGR